MQEKPPEEEDAHNRVFVLESKGGHLEGNADTVYKESVFDICTRYGEAHEWTELGLNFPKQKFVFKIVKQREWKEQILELIGE